MGEGRCQLEPVGRRSAAAQGGGRFDWYSLCRAVSGVARVQRDLAEAGVKAKSMLVE